MLTCITRLCTRAVPGRGAAERYREASQALQVLASTKEERDAARAETVVYRNNIFDICDLDIQIQYIIIIQKYL